jgi:hypothetical protein
MSGTWVGASGETALDMGQNPKSVGIKQIVTGGFIPPVYIFRAERRLKTQWPESIRPSRS